MVLISIHPFAVRKTVLLLVVLLGFSALCFADPVLMVRRHSRDHLRAALPERTSALQSPGTARTGATNIAPALENGDAPELPCFQTQPYQCSLEIAGGTARARFWPTISGD